MADKNQLKIADQVDLADDDPFAELTRIMGFDPRQPARKAPAPAPAEHVAEEDDFSLDLEKELLGGFELQDDISDQDPPAEAAAPIAETPVASDLDDPEVADPEVDFDFSGDFDAAIAASSEAEASVEPEAEFDLGITDLNVTDDDLRAFEAEAAPPVQPMANEPEADFDLGLTDDDLAALEFDAPQLDAPPFDAPSFDAPVEPSPAVDMFAGNEELDAGLDAAMADVDMGFLDEAPAPQSVAPPAADDATEIRQDETVEIAAAESDLHLFDDADFRLEDEPAAAVEPAPQLQPEFDDSALSFTLDEEELREELRVDEAQPAEELAAQPAEEFSFDDVDFAADDLSASEPETAAYPEPVVAEPALADSVEPVATPSFEFSIPPFVPRKLPTSPMDVAAEEYRQRDVASAPAEPEFNLEDELNALLGNIKSNQAAAAATPEPASSFELPAYEPPASAYEPQTYEAASPAAYEPESPRLEERPDEIVSFDPPEHPVDIDDDLNWELDDAFAAEATPEAVEAYQDEEGPVEEDRLEDYADHQPEAYAEDRLYGAYADAGRSEDGYAAEEPAPIEFEDDDFDLSAEDIQPESPQYYGDALAGAAIGAAAASRLDSGFGSRPFEAAPRAYQPERFAAAPSEPEPFSPHRDPVVRGNPLKEDPLDIITALAEKYSKKEPVTPYGRAMGVVTGSSPFGDETAESEDIDISAAFEEQPDVETVEVADQAVALADDLDIPEFAEEELPAAAAYDDLDAEFSSLLSDMNAEPRAQPAAGGYDDTLDGGFNARPYQSQMAAASGASYQASRPARKTYDDDPEPDSFALDADDLPGSRMPSGAQFAADEYDYDPDLDQEIAAPHHLAAESRQKPKSRGMLLAALVGGVALVGAIGAFALSFGDGSGGDAPEIVRADDGPVKVKPENPGGTTVPNQDNKVYETVAGEDASGAPQQEKLVTTAEEPVDVTPPPPAMEETATAPSGKSEDRIEQILQEAENQTDDEIVAVAPRKVRTMVVKPDGTLVPREDEAAAPSTEQTDTIAAAVPEAAAPAIAPEMTGESTGALPTAPQTAATEPTPAETAPAPVAAPEETAAAAPPAQPEQEVAAVEPSSEDRGTMPETAPIAPLRPADQPIEVVGEVQPDQVAAATTAAAGGNWAMQIASQPSEAAAQSSYQDLARRYGGVLEGREVNIVKAEISGKGTFWRVRVPANSRNEAISLCENYKAAGGNCFVSR